MKHLKLLVASLIILFFGNFSAKAGGEKGSSWATKYEHPKCFIENRGQFLIPNSDQKALYAYDNNSTRVFFTKKGVTYSFLKIWQKEEKEGEREKAREKESYTKIKTVAEWQKKEADEHKPEYLGDVVNFEWENSNPNVQIIAEKKIPSYFSYTTKDNKGKESNECFISGYEKIIYKNLYPNIDVEYVFHPTEGLKYSITLHPGADASLIKMKYDNTHALSIKSGDLNIETKLGRIIDHAPVTFYGNNTSAIIESKFVKTNNEITFQLGNYDNTKTVVIDPWTVTPAFATNWDCVWECEKDGAGNVYIIGGVTPLQLLKYNSAGALQWTYNTPYDTTSWLGTFATDNAGNSYVTQGSVAAIIKVTTLGILSWSNPSPGGLFASTEFWNIAFNCDQTQLVIGGTGGFLPPLPYVYNVDVATGNVTASLQVTDGALFPTQEVRSITACGNGKFYWLSHDSIGFFNQNFSFCPTGSTSARYHRSNSYGLGYKCENWRYNNTGINAIRANANFVYTHKGSTIDKRSLTTANILTSVAVPSGAFSGGAVRNSGIDIDACGNVYVGTANAVLKYDANLVLLATYATSSPFNVYDVHVSTAGDIIACGTTGNSGTATRTGYVESFAAGACATLALTCCDATICSPATLCLASAPVTLQAATPGGTWSGTGVSAAGVFNPATAGIGTFTITYTLACGSDAVSIVVSPCSVLSLCQGPGTTATVSAGVGPYSWQTSTVTNPCVGGIGFCGLTPLSVPGPPVTTWTTFYTGTTATLPGSYPIQVVDAGGASIIITDATAYAALAACTSCPTLTVSPFSQVNVTCFGASTGSFNATTAGGTSPWDYVLMNGATTVASFTNVAGTQSFSGLPAGTYTLNVVDNNGCPGTTTITITQPSAATTTSVAGPNQSVCSTSATLAGNTPTVGTGTWSLVSGSGTITTPSSPTSGLTGLGVGANVFLWTISNPPCPSSTSIVTITNTGGPTASVAGINQTVCGTTATLAGNTPTTGTGAWSLVSGTGTITTPSSPTSGITGLGVGANVFQWTITSAPCTPSTSTVTITGVAAPTVANAGPNQTGCTASFTMAANAATSGTGTWTLVSGAGTITSPGSETTTITGLGAGANVFMWTISNPPCTATTSTVTLTNTGGPSTSVAGSNQSVCATTATLAGNTPTVGTGAWSLVSGTGTITSPTSPTSGITGLGVGANVFMWTISNPPCAPSTSTVTITGVAAPTASVAGPNQSLCSSSATFAGNTATVGTGTWTLVSGTGTITSPTSPTSGVTGLGAGANVFMWTISNSPCTSSSSTVTITNTGGPGINTTSQTNVNCNGGSTGTATVAGFGGTGSYTYLWTNGAGTNASATGLSAGTYTVTVTDGVGCSSTTLVTITQPTAITGSVTTLPATCGTSDGSATAGIAGGTGALTYLWNPGGATTSSITGIPAGSYTVNITDSLGCVYSASGSVGSVGGPTVIAGADVTIISGANTLLTSTGSVGSTYSWSPSATLSCDTCSSTIATPTQTTTYTVTVTLNGCTSFDTVTVFVELECGELFVPNVFSPNNDGQNDVLKVYGNCITDFEFVIFDRWGEKVFEISDPAVVWDGNYKGNMLDAAVFVYYLKAKVKGVDISKHGNITLVK